MNGRNNKLITRQTPIALGTVALIVGGLYAAQAYVKDAVTAASDTLRSERSIQYGAIKEDINDIKTQIDTMRAQQRADYDKLMDVLLEIRGDP